MGSLQHHLGRFSMNVTYIVVLTLLCFGCAQFQHQPPEVLPFLDRSQTKSHGDVRVTVAVPSAEETEQIFGFPLERKGVQPVWLEIQNNSNTGYHLWHLSIDPDIYSTGEVAWKFQSGLYSKTSQQKISNLFRENEIKRYFKPGTKTAGFVYTQPKIGYKAILIKLVADEKVVAEGQVIEFMFFVEVSGLKADYHQIDADTHYSEKDFVDLDDDGLREGLEKLPCCTTNKDGSEFGDPLNLVVIGSEEAIWPAFVSRGWDETETTYSASIAKTIMSSIFGRRYRYSPVSPLYVYGRPQDIALQKARETVDERNHLRLWLSPMRYNGMPVYIGQISRDIGVKLTTKSPTLTTHEVDPDIDETRDYLIQDLTESQKVAKIGFADGVGKATPKNPRFNLTGSPYWTDGMRVILVLTKKPTSIVEIDIFFDWRRLYQKYE